MYLAHWGLKRRPFDNAPDTRFFFLAASHDAAMAEMLYAVDEARGAAVLTGPHGSGKTLLVRTLLSGLPPEAYHARMLTNALMDPAEVVLSAARALGADELPESAADISASYAQSRLEARLDALSAGGKRAVLAMDDAHVIEDPRVWEALRLMLNAAPGERLPLTLVLVGGEKLSGRLARIEGFAERVSVRIALAPLADREVPEYILHRLQCAGASRGVFTRRAAEEIARLSGNLPAGVNRLADLALAAAFGLGLKVIGPEVVRLAAENRESPRGGVPAGAG